MASRDVVSAQSAKLMLVVALIIGLSLKEAKGWNYKSGDADGPDNWDNDYFDCGGRMQSPINISSSQSLYCKNLQPFDFSDYSITDSVKMKLENVNGHTAEVLLSGREQYLKNGSLPAPYLLEQFHFHWGRDNYRGSEHCFDGKFYPMEIHFVHRQARFPSLAEAASKPHGLAVLGIRFQIGNYNPKYEPLIQNLYRIVNADAEVEIETFRVRDLLPATSSRLHYYRYEGSLTTPPCFESVIWSLLVDPVEISSSQMNAFRNLSNEEHQPLVDDFRPIQPLNSRVVLCSKNFNIDDDD